MRRNYKKATEVLQIVKSFLKTDVQITSSLNKSNM